MSTRCQIAFYHEDGLALDEWDAMLYRHSDGYPDEGAGVIATLTPVLKSCRNLRDSEYLAAEVIEKMKPGMFGVSNGLHGDEEYFYAVSDKRIRVFRPGDSGRSLEKMMELPEFEMSLA